MIITISRTALIMVIMLTMKFIVIIDDDGDLSLQKILI